MLFMISHKIRRPIANISGLIYLIGHQNNSPDDLKELTGYLDESINFLDNFLKELAAFIHGILQKKNKL